MCRKCLQFYQRDVIELDDLDKVVVSFGNSNLEIGTNNKAGDFDDDAYDGLDTTKGVPSLGVSASYKLTLAHCEHHVINRYSRSIMSSFKYSGVSDSIMAKINKRKFVVHLINFEKSFR